MDRRFQHWKATHTLHTWYERARYEKVWARNSNIQGHNAASIESGADNPEARAKIREMTEEAVEAEYKFDPLIRPDLQIRQRQGQQFQQHHESPTGHADNRYNRSVHIKHGEKTCCVSCWSEFKLEQVVAIFPFLVIIFQVMFVIPWMTREAFIVHGVHFLNKISIAGNSDSHASDGRCKHYTPHTQHFLVCASRLNGRLKVKQIMCPLKELFIILTHHGSFALVLSEHDLQRYAPPFPWHPHLPSLLLPSRDDHQIPPESTDSRTVWSFGHTMSAHRFLSPTPSLRSGVQRFTPIHHPSRRTSFFAQCTIPVRTPRLHLCLRKWMRDKASEGWLHRCFCRREKQVQSQQESLYRRKFDVTLITLSKHGETYSHKRKSCRRHERRTGKTPHKWKNSRWTTWSERIPNRTSSPRRTWSLIRTLVNGISHGRTLLEEQRNQILSEGKSEILLQDSRKRSVDAIRELGRQLRSQKMEIYHRHQQCETSRREQAWLHSELQSCEKGHRDARIKAVQEV